MQTGNDKVQVFKFGGTSVGSALAVRAAAQITSAASGQVIAVVSAMSGVTDLLLDAAQNARRGDHEASSLAAAKFRDRHLELITQLALSRHGTLDLRALVERQANELQAICQSVALLRELTPRTQDLIVARGERLLAQIFCALFQERYRPAVFIDAVDVIFAERRLGSLWPNFERCTRAVHEKIIPLLDSALVVVPGYIGAGPDGEVITLGRGGSDFSAAIMARSASAQSVTLYKEVDGLMTADPKSVSEARVLPELHYREAAELAYYGAKVLHPRTMIPLIEPQIPLHIKNTFNPEFSGTTISAKATVGRYPVKALTSVQKQALISVEGNGMMGVPGVAHKTFGALSAAGHSVSMISQASSEASICFVIPEVDADSARAALLDAFQQEIAAKLIDDIRVERQIALIAVVGLGMRGTRGIAARTFSALAKEGINIVAMAQGSSELNITMVIQQMDTTKALQALHREYQLDRLRPLPDNVNHETALTILGFGQIGRTLSRQLVAQKNYFLHGLGFTLEQVALIDKSGMLLEEHGFSADSLEQIISQKENEQPLVQNGSGDEPLIEVLRRRLFALPSHRSILADLTAADTAPLLQEALERGYHVVLANKKPLAAPQEQFDKLFETAKERGISLRYEATVGAGLPILDTLHKLKEAGDPVHRVLGCLSGTLGYLMSQVEDGVRFSEAVRQAYELGYTEPDPRDDLCGMDVGRKALILARSMGRRLELGDIAVTSLYPDELSDADPKRFLDNLRALDEVFAQRLQEAKAEDKVLRYVARIDTEQVAVGLEAVPAASPLGRLRGTDNTVVFYTKRYAQNPLVVTGPGAGAEVTAAGVLNDIVAISSPGRFTGPTR